VIFLKYKKIILKNTNLGIDKFLYCIYTNK